MPDQDPHLPSLPRRLLAVFLSPGELFERLSRDPAWAGALLLGAVLGAAAAVLVPTELYEVGIREQLLRAGRPVPDDLSTASNLARIAGSLVALVVGPIITALMAGVVAFIFTFVLGGQGSYRQHLAVVAHAFLVPAMSALALVPLKIQAADLQLRLSVGTFLPFLDEGWLSSALGWLDLFGLWGWVLVALGVSKIDPKRSWGSAAAVVLGLVVFVTMVVAVIMALR
jgi:hypothetical protein